MADGGEVPPPGAARSTLERVFQVGPLEMLLVAVIALIVLGPQRLPDAARAMGRGMREFKNAVSGEDDDDDRERLREPSERAG